MSSKNVHTQKLHVWVSNDGDSVVHKITNEYAQKCSCIKIYFIFRYIYTSHHNFKSQEGYSRISTICPRGGLLTNW